MLRCVSGGMRDQARHRPLLEGIVGAGGTGHLVEGCRETLPAEKWGKGGYCSELQPGLTRLEDSASGAAEAPGLLVSSSLECLVVSA